jgi:hypothetical protein
MADDSDWSFESRILLDPNGTASVEITLFVDLAGRIHSTVLPIFRDFESSHEAASFVGEWTARWMIQNDTHAGSPAP